MVETSEYYNMAAVPPAPMATGSKDLVLLSELYAYGLYGDVVTPGGGITSMDSSIQSMDCESSD